MRYFLDTEFWENDVTLGIEPISIALVAEDGREFYAEIPLTARWYIGERKRWVREHVFPHLRFTNRDVSAVMYAHDIPDAILAFIAETDDETPEFWGYYCDYDWVLVSQLFGGMSGHPDTWPYYCRDLRQALDERGFMEVKQLDDARHNALDDARWIAKTHDQWITQSAFQSDFAGKWWMRNDPPYEAEPTDADLAAGLR